MKDEEQQQPEAGPRRTRRKKGRSGWRLFGLSLLVVGVLVAGGLLYVGFTLASSAPELDGLDWSTSTIIYDRTGAEVYRLHSGENRTPVKLSQIPQSVIDAFIAIEDPKFRQHHGIDPRGLVRAAWRTGLHLLGLPGGRIEGGSTITQQLARDAWLSQEVSVKRKVQEAWLAIQLERKYSKDQILEMYLNQIYFGQGAYGVQAAAGTFFGKEVGELNLPESAQLAGMVNGPSLFDPYTDMEASLARRDLVLEAMLREQVITEAEFTEAKAFQPTLARKETGPKAEANHFIDYVITILNDAKPGLAAQYGLKLQGVGSIARAGLQVYTSLDPNLQRLAERAIADRMVAADQQYGIPAEGPKPEAAAVMMNPQTGEVLAMVGGRTRKGMLEFNRATDALRQPGSVIKPLVAYIPAIQAGLSPATILDDAPVMLSNDRSTVWPQNYDFRYQGLKPARFGVEQSINPMAVRAMIASGGPKVGADLARRLGMSTIGSDDENLALALGGLSQGTTVLDLTAAFSAVANLGQQVRPVLITKILDRNGELLFEAVPKKEQVIAPAAAYLMIDMMRDVIRRGTAYGFTGGFKGWPAAGKTGTTEDNRDAWFTGFTPELVLTVWNGYDTPSNHLPWTGAFEPVKIWNQIMTQAVPSRPGDWPRPADVVSVTICRRTGMLPNELCPKEQVVQDLFLRGTEPKTAGNLLVKAKAVQVTVTLPNGSSYQQWQLWQLGCAGKPVERLFIQRPEPRVTHPTDPWNPRYVPADVVDEVPTVTCERNPLLDLLLKPGEKKSDQSEKKGGNKSGTTGEESGDLPATDALIDGLEELLPPEERPSR